MLAPQTRAPSPSTISTGVPRLELPAQRALRQQLAGRANALAHHALEMVTAFVEMYKRKAS